MGKIVKGRLVATVQIDVQVDEDQMRASPNFARKGDTDLYQLVHGEIVGGKMIDALQTLLHAEYEDDNGDGFTMTAKAEQTYADVWIATKGEEN